MKVCLHAANHWPTRVALLLLTAFQALSSYAAEPALKRFEFSELHMGVPFKLVLYAADVQVANAAARAAFDRVAALDRVLSDYMVDSELSRLNRTQPNQWVKVSSDLWQVLSRSQKLARETSGAFDITVGAYVRLWRRARREKQLPSPELLAQARAVVGYRLLELDAESQSARLLKSGMRLDAGAIGMGYAVDEALKRITAHGIKCALLDASGDIGVTDPPPGQRGWKVAVSPRAKDEGSTFLTLSNAAVTTSGDALQHVDIAGKRYSHIIDPRTGLGLTTQTASTVVAGNCTTADSLATAVTVLGPRDGLAFIEKTPGARALMVVANHEGATKRYMSRLWR